MAEAGGGHCRRKSHKDINFVVQGRVDTERGEGLGGPLREADVRQGRLMGGREDIVDGVGDIVEREFVNREIPEFRGGGRESGRLSRVFVAAIVSKLG